MKTNIQAWRDRCARATSPADCDKLDAALNRLWDAGAITRREFDAMDKAACARREALKTLFTPTT